MPVALPLDTPLAIAAAIASVLLVGLSKGGLGGAMAMLGVPLMSLTMPPMQAAGILLPILLVMDAVSLWTWWGEWDRRTLMMMLPGGLAGIAVGWATAALVPEEAVRFIVGVVAVVFVLRWAVVRFTGGAPRLRGQRLVPATVWGAAAGYTSFVAHAGGPPYQVYTMPLGLHPRVFTSTSVAFFAIVNLVKLGPYIELGQVGGTNLVASVVLMPLAAVATLAGAWVVRRLNPNVFFGIMYAMVLLVGLRLVYAGLVDLVGPL